MKILFVASQGIGNLIAKLPAMTVLNRFSDLSIFTTSLGAIIFNYFGFVENNVIVRDTIGEFNIDDIISKYDFIFNSAPIHGDFFPISDHEKVLNVRSLWKRYSEMEMNLKVATELVSSSAPFNFGQIPQITKKEKTIGVSIGSTNSDVWVKKRWPNIQWNSLITYLLDKDYDVTVYGTTKDLKDAEGFSFLETNIFKEKRVKTVFNESLEQVFDSIKEQEFFIGTDSGLTKAASALACKTFCLYGPTDTVKNKLYKEIPIIGEASCSPCQYDWDKFSACQNQICFPSVDKVLSTFYANI